METLAERTVPARDDRARDVIGLIVAWGTWAALTVALFLYVRHYSRNVPYWDEFAMVPVMTGAEPVSLEWAWSQHNEHRPLISRLIMAGLFRWVALDFRVVRYANAALLSAMGAAMLAMARRLRGEARATDAVLPLSLLGIAQVESLMIGFAMNLVLTSVVAVALIAAAGVSRRGRGSIAAIGFGLGMILLPLCGGSGLVMLPPLGLWLAGYVASGWRSAERPSPAVRAAGGAMILATVAIVLLYLRGYERPASHPLPRSATSIASSIVMYISLAVYPRVMRFWWPAGSIAVALFAATLGLLARVARRKPEERPRALGLMAVLLSILCVAVAVGYGRSAFGPAWILASRYVTLTSPMLCVLYMSWLLYGKGRLRMGVHAALAALLLLASPEGWRFAREYGTHVHNSEALVENCLIRRVPTSVLMKRGVPLIFPDAASAASSFELLKEARVGAFASYNMPRVARKPGDGTSVRR